jgi:hypothetical protein
VKFNPEMLSIWFRASWSCAKGSVDLASKGWWVRYVRDTVIEKEKRWRPISSRSG